MANRFGWKENWREMENKEEMGKKKFMKRDGMIMSPSSHDITESNVELAIKVFKNILEPGNELLIVSKPKGSLIKKVCKAIEPWKKQVLFRFTIGTLNDKIRAYWEPGAPTINERLEALEYAHENDWRTSVSVEPFLDENVVGLVRVLIPLVSDTIWIGPMNKIHVPKELWTEKEKKLYSPKTLIQIKEEVDALNSNKIRYKDHFLANLKKYPIKTVIII